MLNNNSSISFNGLKINGVVPSKSLKKLGEFTSATENHGFIEYLEKSFNTDIVLNNKLDEISFSHQTYGDLTKFGCPIFSAKDFFSKVVDAMKDIKNAINKAEKKHTKELNELDAIKRGC